MISAFVQSVGYTPQANNPMSGDPLLPGSIDSYWLVALELSRLNRLERRVLGNKMKEKMTMADNATCGEGYCFMPTEFDEGLIFYSTNTKSRQKRIDRLSVLASTAYAGYNLKQVIGIATEPLRVNSRSYDIVVFKDIVLKNKDQLKDQFKRIFSKPKNFNFHEYDDNINLDKS